MTWYLADLVIEFCIANEPRNVVHINTCLVQADTPHRAYERALALGTGDETSYENTDGNIVRVRFRGIHALFEIYEDLEDGAELIYSETIGMAEPDLQALLLSREELAIFQPRIPPSRTAPNYMPRSVVEQLSEAGYNLDDMYRSDTRED